MVTFTLCYGEELKHTLSSCMIPNMSKRSYIDKLLEKNEIDVISKHDTM